MSKRPLDPELLRRLEYMAREVGYLIGHAIRVNGIPYGFALLMFSYDGPELTYISNAQRDDMVRALEEFIGKVKGGEASLTSERKN